MARTPPGGPVAFLTAPRALVPRAPHPKLPHP
eukprot:CAMPEP_0179170412 /NCGR_PEP_ID=MMETSP0796-20121207/83947_1 /TAXON_ID=73915 /ORGANISM="Pyrodinium bahamense, Strain pbaha01" /LENGTH=31 /DNA_ID= /DNA_START= /DNA_END= /DNA_ORIENTATION=